VTIWTADCLPHSCQC